MMNSKDRITSRANPRVKELCKLKDAPSPSRFLIEGKHLCGMAFEAGCLLEVYALEEQGYPGVQETLVNEDVLRKIAYSPAPSGIVGVATHKAVAFKARKVLVIDRVQDPGNVGTLLRSAVAFGYDRVYLTKGSASPFGYKAIAASQGAIFRLGIQEGCDPIKSCMDLKGQGYRLVSGALRDAIPLSEVELGDDPFALVVGNEGQGIDPKILALSDIVAKIEMEGIESLNVGVAGGILMYCL